VPLFHSTISWPESFHYCQRLCYQNRQSQLPLPPLPPLTLKSGSFKNPKLLKRFALSFKHTFSEKHFPETKITTTQSFYKLLKVLKMGFVHKLALFAFGFAATVHGHIAMTNPVPYGKPDTSPLNPSGSNYPCKTDNGFSFSNATTMAVGSPQTLSFTGTAVHNGGSCQLSVTPGYTPTTNSDFKVIYSILGSCPGTGGTTNQYQFSIPADVPNGQYSLAWTWYNQIGNREIYMNCAPITVTGSAGTPASLSALPDLAIYNIPSKNTCGTLETFDVAFPDPGKYLTTGTSYKPTPPASCGVKAVVPTGSGGAGAGAATTGSAPSATAANNGQYTPASAAPAVTATSHVTQMTTAVVTQTAGGNFAEGSSSSLITVPSSPPTTSILSALAPADTATAAAPAAPASTGSAQSPASGMQTATCATDGALVCSDDGTLQGLCNFGKVLLTSVAAGTKCVNGAIMKRSSAKFYAWR
jgi:hypothetical protein